MKYCPTCQTRYDEEIIRFCTKDGTPLVSEEEPNFIEMPSESLSEPEAVIEDDPSEVTIVRNHASTPPPVPDDDMNFDEPAQRIVVPTAPEPQTHGGMPPGQRAYQPSPRSNTFKVVVLTFLGTVIILGAAGIVFWALIHERGTATNTNSNLSNQNTNVNTMIDSNFNFNVGNIENVNSNANANLKTPTPTPKPTPSPSVSPTESPVNANSANTNAAPPFTPRPTPVV